MEKLSVQERLSLAAKTKSKKKAKKQSSKIEPVDNTSAVSPSPFVSETCATIEVGDVPLSKEQVSSKSLAGEIPISDVVAFFSQLLGDSYNFEHVNTSDLLRDLFPVVSKLQKDMELFSNSVDRSNANPSDSSLIKLLKEKDSKIEELLQEEKTFSKKEQKLSNQLQSLDKTIRELRSDLNIRNDDLQECKAQVEVLQRTNQSLKASLVEVEKQLQDKDAQRKKAEAEFSKLLSDYKLLKDQHTGIEERNKELLQNLDESTKEKAKLCHQFDIKYNALRQTSQEEMTRLESQLEQLRISVETEHGHDRTEGSDGDYEKILSQYHITQNELKETNENWKAIESALNDKIFILESSLQELREKNENLDQELYTLHGARDKLLSELETNSDIRSKLEQELLESKSLLSQSNEQLESLKEDYNLVQRQNSILSKRLADLLNNHDKTSYPEPAVDTKLEFLEIPNMATLKVDTSAAPLWDGHVTKLETEVAANYANTSIPEFSLEPDEDIPEEAADLELDKRRQSSNSMNLDSSYTRPNTGQAPIANNTNVQMVSKLAAEIRRLEMELSSVKEGRDRLSHEKDEANSEIARLLQLSDEFEGIVTEKEDLEKHVIELTKKQENLLQLLGEKSERVEELENDVEDLKDMMRSQFQQIAQLQEKSR